MLKASLNYTVKPYLKKQTKNPNQTTKHKKYCWPTAAEAKAPTPHTHSRVPPLQTKAHGAANSQPTRAQLETLHPVSWG